MSLMADCYPRTSIEKSEDHEVQNRCRKCGCKAGRGRFPGWSGSMILLVFFLLLPPSARLRAQPSHPVYLGGTEPEGRVERIVSLAPNLTEIAFALGAGDKIVGVTKYDDHPPAVEKLPRVGGFVDPSLEGILALEPDLVVCVPNPGGRDRMDVLARMGVAVLVLPSYSLQDIFVVVEKMGQVLDRERRASELVESMKSEIKRVKARIGGKKRPRVLLVYGHKPLVAAGKGSFANTLLTIAGGNNVLGDSSVRYPTVPAETVIGLQPQVVIDASASGTGSELDRQEARKFWNRWKVIPAVKNDRVYVFDSALWFRPGPRIVEGLERLSLLLHPELEEDMRR